MEPLTAARLETARRQWGVQGVDSYRVVVRVRPPRAKPSVYDVRVVQGTVAGVERDGEPVAPTEVGHSDYSVGGLFEMLRQDLSWNAVERIGDTPPIDLRAQFEPETGRLLRYRRTVGTSRRRVLLVEVLEYEQGTPRSEVPDQAARADDAARAARTACAAPSPLATQSGTPTPP
jgi:hypothetical protein